MHLERLGCSMAFLLRGFEPLPFRWHLYDLVVSRLLDLPELLDFLIDCKLGERVDIGTKPLSEFRMGFARPCVIIVYR